MTFKLNKHFKLGGIIMKSSVFKINILIFTIIISCTLIISTLSHAQQNSSFKGTNNVFSFDLLWNLFSPTSSWRGFSPEQVSNTNTNAVNSVAQRKSTGDSVPRIPKGICEDDDCVPRPRTPKSDPGCGNKCGNNEGGL
jgi:hypothetical protein